MGFMSRLLSPKEDKPAIRMGWAKSHRLNFGVIGAYQLPLHLCSGSHCQSMKYGL